MVKTDYKERTTTKTELSSTFYCLLQKKLFNYKKYDVIDEHKTFKSFTNVSDNLDRKEYFIMADGGKLIAKVPLSWKKVLVKELLFHIKRKIALNVKKTFYVKFVII